MHTNDSFISVNIFNNGGNLVKSDEDGNSFDFYFPSYPYLFFNPPYMAPLVLVK